MLVALVITTFGPWQTGFAAQIVWEDGQDGMSAVDCHLSNLRSAIKIWNESSRLYLGTVEAYRLIEVEGSHFSLVTLKVEETYFGEPGIDRVEFLTSNTIFVDSDGELAGTEGMGSSWVFVGDRILVEVHDFWRGGKRVSDFLQGGPPFFLRPDADDGDDPTLYRQREWEIDERLTSGQIDIAENTELHDFIMVSRRAEMTLGQAIAVVEEATGGGE